MTRPQAIFWDTFSTVPVANKVSSAGAQGGRDKKESPFGKSNLKKLFGELLIPECLQSRNVPHIILGLKCS